MCANVDFWGGGVEEVGVREVELGEVGAGKHVEARKGACDQGTQLAQQALLQHLRCPSRHLARAIAWRIACTTVGIASTY